MTVAVHLHSAGIGGADAQRRQREGSGKVLPITRRRPSWMSTKLRQRY